MSERSDRTKEIITAQTAGRILNMNGQAVREHIKRRIPPFDKCGYVFLKEGNQKRQYLVYTRKLLNEFGISEDIAEERIR